MSSSKFSSPFFQKSPLLGAYSSGAGGMITISNAADIQKMQDGIVGGTLAAIGGAKEKDDIKNQKANYKKIGLDATGKKEDDNGFDTTTQYTEADYNIDSGYRQTAKGGSCPVGYHFDSKEKKCVIN